jgi:hypothetical protein
VFCKSKKDKEYNDKKEKAIWATKHYA